MTIATVVTRGYGSFGTIPLVVTAGYDISLTPWVIQPETSTIWTTQEEDDSIWTIQSE